MHCFRWEGNNSVTAIRLDEADIYEETDTETEYKTYTTAEIDESEEDLSTDKGLDMENIFNHDDERHRRVHEFASPKSIKLCMYLTLALFLLAGIISLTMVFGLIVRPYLKASGFAECTCTVANTSSEAEEKRCSCGQGCDSSFICLKLKVTLSCNSFNNTDILEFAENELLLGKEVSI